jgi:hypothetical protein
MEQTGSPAKVASTAGLGPLPEAGMTEANPYFDLGPLDPHRGAQILTWYSADQMQAYALAERERSRRAIEGLYWMPRVPGRWDETDVAHAEGFNKAKADALRALGPN